MRMCNLLLKCIDIGRKERTQFITLYVLKLALNNISLKSRFEALQEGYIFDLKVLFNFDARPLSDQHVRFYVLCVG